MKKSIALSMMLCSTFIAAQIEELTDAKKDTLKSGHAVVKFYSTTCPNCKDEKNFYNTLSEKTAGVKFYQVNQAQNAQLTQEYGVTALPTFIFIENGQQDKEKTLVGMHEAHVESNAKSLARKAGTKKVASAPKKMRANTH